MIRADVLQLAAGQRYAENWVRDAPSSPTTAVGLRLETSTAADNVLQSSFGTNNVPIACA